MVARRLARRADEVVARMRVGAGREPSGLLALIFHTIEPDGSLIGDLPLAPYQRLTVKTLITIIRNLKNAGYDFVDPADILAGLDPKRRHVWLTFDDGYANNLVLADLAAAEGAKFTVFVSTGPVETGAAYWWDALWRARRGVPYGAFLAEVEALKRLPAPVLAEELAGMLGPDALRPQDDRDRPMTIAELQRFAAAPGISIGNHTRNHAILPLLSVAAQAAELARCQADLAAWLGAAPLSVAYPNGGHDDDTVAAAARCGLRLAVTTTPGRAGLPLADRLRVPRIALAENYPQAIGGQLVRARAGIFARG